MNEFQQNSEAGLNLVEQTNYKERNGGRANQGQGGERGGWERARGDEEKRGEGESLMLWGGAVNV